MTNNLRIFNTLNGKKDIFKPRKGKNVNLFVCGPTVYDYSHIGHAKNYIAFDSFVKYLRFSRGYLTGQIVNKKYNIRVLYTINTHYTTIRLTQHTAIQVARRRVNRLIFFICRCKRH
jgi:hypothetical protein